MKETYTLDTSAIMSYFLGEDVKNVVSHILSLAQKHETAVYVSFMSFMEILYRVWKLSDEETGRNTYIMLRNLPVKEVMQDEDLLIKAADIKAQNNLSVADAWIAATSLKTGSTLVHKDPEMDKIKGIKLKKL